MKKPTHLLTRQEPVNIEKFLSEENTSPTMEFFWLHHPGKITESTTGKEFTSLGETPGVEHYCTLLEVIRRAASLIHKNSLWQPANLLFVNDAVGRMLATFDSYQSLSADESKEKEKEHNFDEKTKITGVINNRYMVCVNEAMPCDKILVGLLGNGLEYQLPSSNSGGIPMVQLKVTNNPKLAKGELAYWTFVNLLDMEN